MSYPIKHQAWPAAHRFVASASLYLAVYSEYQSPACIVNDKPIAQGDSDRSATRRLFPASRTSLCPLRPSEFMRLTRRQAPFRDAYAGFSANSVLNIHFRWKCREQFGGLFVTFFVTCMHSDLSRGERRHGYTIRFSYETDRQRERVIFIATSGRLQKN